MLKILAFVSCGLLANSLWAQSPYFPEVGPAALHQRTLDLKSNLHVLSIALQPGFEDFSALAYYRMGKGATVMSVYLTNGEGGESDLRSEYPTQLAAIRREEAWKATQMLNAEAYFLNVPDIPAVATIEELRELWVRDSVQYELMRVISQFRPDLILIARDQESNGPSLRWNALVEDVIRAVERLRFVTTDAPPKDLPPFPRWTTSRVVADHGSGQGMTLPIATNQSFWKKSYAALGDEVADSYETMKLQRNEWNGMKKGYRVVFPTGGKSVKAPDEGLPDGVPAELQSVATLVEKTIRIVSQVPPAEASSRPRAALTALADAVEAIDVRLAYASERPTRERKVLLGWKEALENLRLTLLGVTVSYTMPETNVTELQLVYFTVDKVTGLSDSGKTEIYFPAVGRGLILNEQLENRMTLSLREPYRLLFQKASPFSSPQWIFGLEDHTLRRPLFVFIIHKAKRREENFIHRSIVPVEFVPRLMPEILTPIVKMVPNERLVYRITNNSRDGIRDSLHANDSLVVSTKSGFRLNEKGATKIDTLILNWNGEFPDGSHLLPIKIGEVIVESYVARKFDVEKDSTKKVGVVQSFGDSPLLEAIRRIGLPAVVLQPATLTLAQLDAIDVLVLDRRSMTVHSELQQMEARHVLEMFVERGGHVIILSQDAGVWNTHPLVPGITLKRSSSFSAFSPLVLDSLNAALLFPNRLTDEDWSNWIYRKAFHTVTLAGNTTFGVLVRGGNDATPLVVIQRKGKGLYTYIDLDLQHQFFNIHAGALRLLANIIAR